MAQNTDTGYHHGVQCSGRLSSDDDAGCTGKQVKLGDGSKGSLFDALEDTNAAVCLEKAKKINADN